MNSELIFKILTTTAVVFGIVYAWILASAIALLLMDIFRRNRYDE